MSEQKHHAGYKQRVQIHTLHDLGWTYARIATHLDLTKRQVQYLIHQPKTPKKRTGRPIKINTPKRKLLVDFILSSSSIRRMSCLEIPMALDWEVSENTVRNALRMEGFHRRIARIKPFLSEAARLKTLALVH